MYDVKMHLPQQIEYMLMAEREGDLDRFEMAINNIKEMVMENGVAQDIRDYEKERDNSIEEGKENALKELTTALDRKTYEEMLSDINDIEQQRQAVTNEIMLKYMNNVKTYLLGYMPHVKIQGYE